VTTKRFGGRPASVGIYDTAIPDPIEAVEAVRMVCDAGADTIVEAIAELISGTDLRNGGSAAAVTIRLRKNRGP
jgi:hypothetical protein